MAKWQYLTLIVSGAFGDTDSPIVISVNGETPAGTIPGKGFFAVDKKPALHSYLQAAGQVGWEVAGVSPAAGSEGAPVSRILVILKRPMP
jgi:hypothetical protein